MTKGEKAKLRRDQLEDQLKPLRKVNLTVPRRGWLRSIREALGMTGAQLSGRLGITPAAVAQLELSEASKTISLATLEHTAKALGCRLSYALIPESNLHDAMQKRAEQLLAQSKTRVDHTMDLEGQRSKKSVRDSLKESYLILTLPRDFWNDD